MAVYPLPEGKGTVQVMISEAPSTLTTIGLIVLVSSLPLAVITGAIDMYLNTWPGFFFLALVTLVIGTTLAFAGAL
jgi:hypothetical protein